MVKGRSREGGPMHPNALADAVKGRLRLVLVMAGGGGGGGGGGGVSD